MCPNVTEIGNEGRFALLIALRPYLTKCKVEKHKAQQTACVSFHINYNKGAFKADTVAQSHNQMGGYQENEMKRNHRTTARTSQGLPLSFPRDRGGGNNRLFF